jgi:hypothetical protein
LDCPGVDEMVASSRSLDPSAILVQDTGRICLTWLRNRLARKEEPIQISPFLPGWLVRLKVN